MFYCVADLFPFVFTFRLASSSQRLSSLVPFEFQLLMVCYQSKAVGGPLGFHSHLFDSNIYSSETL